MARSSEDSARGAKLQVNVITRKAAGHRTIQGKTEPKSAAKFETNIDCQNDGTKKKKEQLVTLSFSPPPHLVLDGNGSHGPRKQAFTDDFTAADNNRVKE